MTIFAILAIAISTAAQTTDEQEIMKIHHSLETSFIKGELGPFEAAMAESYTFSGPDGKEQTRAEVLKDMRDELAKPNYKNISGVSDNVKIRVLGNAAYVTAGWTSVSQALGDGSEPHTDKGQYTGIYEKIGGKWMLVREAITEAQHDRKAMEAGVVAASKMYDNVMKSRDKAGYERLLSSDYLYTNEDGKLVSRVDDIENFVSEVPRSTASKHLTKKSASSAIRLLSRLVFTTPSGPTRANRLTRPAAIRPHGFGKAFAGRSSRIIIR